RVDRTACDGNLGIGHHGRCGVSAEHRVHAIKVVGITGSHVDLRGSVLGDDVGTRPCVNDREVCSYAVPGVWEHIDALHLVHQLDCCVAAFLRCDTRMGSAALYVDREGCAALTPDSNCVWLICGLQVQLNIGVRKQFVDELPGSS